MLKYGLHLSWVRNYVVYSISLLLVGVTFEELRKLTKCFDVFGYGGFGKVYKGENFQSSGTLVRADGFHIYLWSFGNYI